MKYTDAHVHFGERGTFDPQDAVIKLIEDMNANDVEQVFIFPIGGGNLERNEVMRHEDKGLH